MSNKMALLVVDVQAGVMKDVWDAPRIVKNIEKAVAKARASKAPVIWVQHSDDDLIYESPEWMIVDELSPGKNELRIDKHFNSGFEQSSLDQTLKQLGIGHIVLTGAARNWCIRATAYAALDRGYDLTLVEDAHSTQTLEFENGEKIEAQKMILELNTAMQWLTYPGHRNHVISIDKLEFNQSI